MAKWLHEPVATPPKYRRSVKVTKLRPYHEVLKLALKADAHRPKRERRTARALYTEIKAAGYEGGYTRVTDFIREWRRGEGQVGMRERLRAAAVRAGRSIPVRLERGGLGDRGHLPARAGVAT